MVEVADVNVLLIEDDPDVSKSFTGALERQGFRVTAVNAADRAFEELRRSSFDVIVCDVILPRMEGTTFFDRLKDDFPNMTGRVLFVTGWSGEEKTRRLVEYTGRPFLQKPVEMDVLVKAVREIAAGLPGAGSSRP